MTKDRQAKRAARQRALVTGEPYALARRQVTAHRSPVPLLALDFRPPQSARPTCPDCHRRLVVATTLTLAELFAVIAATFADQHPAGTHPTLWLADGRAFTACTDDAPIPQVGAAAPREDAMAVTSVLVAGDTALYTTTGDFVRVITATAVDPPAAGEVDAAHSNDAATPSGQHVASFDRGTSASSRSTHNP